MNSNLLNNSERNAVICAENFSLRENYAELMLLEWIIKSRVNFHAVKQNGRAEASAEINIQTADDANAIFISSVSQADIRRNRQTCLAF